MKKYLLISITVLGMAGSAHAVDYVTKRQLMAQKTVMANTQIVEGLLLLKQIQAERVSLGGANDFQETDFTSAPVGYGIRHLDAYTIGVFLDTVAPILISDYLDVSLNRDTMNKVKP